MNPISHHQLGRLAHKEYTSQAQSIGQPGSGQFGKTILKTSVMIGLFIVMVLPFIF